MSIDSRFESIMSVVCVTGSRSEMVSLPRKKIKLTDSNKKLTRKNIDELLRYLSVVHFM